MPVKQQKGIFRVIALIWLIGLAETVQGLSSPKWHDTGDHTLPKVLWREGGMQALSQLRWSQGPIDIALLQKKNFEMQLNDEAQKSRLAKEQARTEQLSADADYELSTRVEQLKKETQERQPAILPSKSDSKILLPMVFQFKSKFP